MAFKGYFMVVKMEKYAVWHLLKWKIYDMILAKTREYYD